jgi:hypothetical protein
MFTLFNELFFRKKEREEKKRMDGPYRTPAEMPAPIPDPPKPKPKRQFKMPSVKLSKTIKLFMCLLPICGCLIGMGVLYDAPVLGLGIKWGLAAALAVMAGFFATRVVVVVDGPS